jgi:ABC-2 type transport system ATP-binding protein
MGSAVLLVTHNVLEAEKAVDRLAIISNGRVLLEGTPGALKAEVSNAYHLELLLANGQIPELPAYTLTSHTQGNRLTITIPSEQVERAMAWANELRLRNVAEEFNLGAATLENIYTQMMDREKIPVELVEA